MKRFITRSLFAVVLAAGCGGSSSSPSQGSAAPNAIPDTPLTTVIGVIHGDVETRSGGTWQALTDSRSGVSEVRTHNRGAVLSIGNPDSPIARLWLRANSRAKVSQDSTGNIYLAMTTGHARIRALDSSVPIFVEASDRLVNLDGGDVVVRRIGTDVKLAFTRTRPAAAEWSIDIEGDREATGVGTLEARGESGDLSHLELRKLTITATTAGDHAITEVEHVFFNPADEQREGTFRFPVPDRAMLTGLAMEINGHMMQGELVEKMKARRTYESIVNDMQDPALLEWEEGNWFKLRVFPIEANSEKRVVIRYVAPLRRGIDGFEYTYDVIAPELQSEIGQFKLTVDGTVVDNTANLRAGKEIVVALPETAVPQVSREVRKDGIYTAVRLTPKWSSFETNQELANQPRSVIVMFDTSRSAMEGRSLALDTLRMLLAELRAKDSFALITVDVTAELHFGGFVNATEQNVGKALALVEQAELDGASDLGAALIEANKLIGDGMRVQMIYIGDGTPTWGITKPDELAKLATAKLANATLYAAIVGRGANTELWNELTGLGGGVAVRPQSPLAARKLAFFLAHSAATPRLEGAHVAAADGATIFPARNQTLFFGESLEVLMRTPADKTPPTALTLQATRGGKAYSQRIVLASAKTIPHIATRWARYHIADLERGNASKDDIVEASQSYGLMSKHTSFLVLESEEAYREHQIERRNRDKLLAQNDVPQVSGGDLDNLGGRSASLSPDHIQPGDPEIQIPAPADALSVVIVFPFGDTKIAEFDTELNTWITRFLIDKDTPDGTYHVLVRITHADGRIETMRLPYVVDTVAPEVDVELQAVGRKTFRIVVKQKEDSEHAFDAHRVEVQLPSGRSMYLYRIADEDGLYRRNFVPEVPLSGEVKLRIVVTDRALNQRTLDLTLPVPTR